MAASRRLGSLSAIGVTFDDEQLVADAWLIQPSAPRPHAH